MSLDERTGIDFDIAADLGEWVPAEPIPDHTNNDDQWDDIEADNAKDDIFDHFLSASDVKSRQDRPKQYNKTQSYRARLESEKKHWTEQEDQLLNAYMKWNIDGPTMEKDGEGIALFDCTVIGIASECSFPLFIHYLTN